MYINLISVFVRLNMDQQELFECDQSFFPSWQSPNYGPKLLPQPNTTFLFGGLFLVVLEVLEFPWISIGSTTSTDNIRSKAILLPIFVKVCQ